MPIYAYKCESCGYAKDVLQKMSDALLTDCPHCGASSFKKQLTAAGFQLKGSGWYVTDFRGGDGAAQAAKSADDSPAPAATAASAGSKPADGAGAAPAAAASSSPVPAPASPAAGSAPASKAA
ncbi:FmdB family zinc ribbon protein [Polaromonas sp.]|uniref:FmdB family zinc ribbon protein n=1 Tax=Polaromonas sp. TaxID=1869339 RepID=UPI00286A3D26|nr:FmdB family zinc ribbon protein [Polaromonas sp.]